MKLQLRVPLALVAAGVCTSLALVGSSPAQGSRDVMYGINDDAWLVHGPGTLDRNLEELTRLGVDVVRFTVRWNRIASKRPQSPREHGDRAYDWDETDAVLRGLRRHGIDALITLVGTPGWANGGRAANWAPTSNRSFANFAYAAAKRYPWVRHWTIWNEPNRSTWLRPTTARTYVEKLLNPAYAQLHAVIDRVQVGGGVTAPRAGSAGVSPVAWIRAMADAGARLDAYAHHPYPGRPNLETPWSPACASCSTITMADLERLDVEVKRAFGPKRIWLTEYGYQTNPPDIFLGVEPETQARYTVSAALRAYLAARVDMLVFFLVRDDTADEGWQSGLLTAAGERKPAYGAFRFPLTQTFRRGELAGLWGQVRPRSGRQQYRLRLDDEGRSSWVGGTRWTDARGFFSIAVSVPAGASLRVWSPRDAAFGHALQVR
jgi:hypothetical protein